MLGNQNQLILNRFSNPQSLFSLSLSHAHTYTHAERERERECLIIECKTFN